MAPILAARGPPRPLPRGLLGSLGVPKDLQTTILIDSGPTWSHSGGPGSHFGGPGLHFGHPEAPFWRPWGLIGFQASQHPSPKPGDGGMREAFEFEASFQHFLTRKWNLNCISHNNCLAITERPTSTKHCKIHIETTFFVVAASWCRLYKVTVEHATSA